MKILPYNFEDDLIRQVLKDREACMRVYSPEETTVVLGYGSKPDVELNIEAIEKDRIKTYRRRGGGCAVVLDPGNVIVTVVLPSSGFGKINEYFETISNWLIDGLKKSKVDGIYREGICDLVIDDRKIGGACMQRKRDYVYYSASLPVNPDIRLMEEYLMHPPREPGYRKHRTHRDFVGTLEEIAGVKNIKIFSGKLENNLVLEFLSEATSRL